MEPVMSLEALTNQFIQAGLALAFFAIAYFARVAVKAIAAFTEEKIGKDKYLLLKDLAVTIVRSLQQNGAFDSYDGERKKALALVYLRGKAAELGFDIDTVTLDHMIEEAVQIMKVELSKEPLVKEFSGK
jgi:hypothetical protein